MKLQSVLGLAEKHGDFYLYYNKQKAAGVTFLVGTTNFVNAYIIDKAMSGTAGVPADMDRETFVHDFQAQMNKQGKVVVFSWTNDKFRILDAKDVQRVVPLSKELHGRNHR